MGLIQTALTWGACLSSLHFCWVILVASGWAQPLLNFIFKLHMLNSPFQVQEFNPFLAIGLLVITFLIGCLYGALFYFVKKKFTS